MSIFDFKRKKYRTFLQDSETGEEIAEEYEKGRGVWKKHDVQDGKGSEMRVIFRIADTFGANSSIVSS